MNTKSIKLIKEVNYEVASALAASASCLARAFLVASRFRHAVMYDRGWIGKNPERPEMKIKDYLFALNISGWYIHWDAHAEKVLK